ncbi:hypothetical protein [Spongiactinospora rosea]|uniref:hypothetical protein n=1 Tax=Spongiactinospora rosea TaxID=2248750 RepID=UPI0011C04DF8|nr:hypothetical protein [Spongiactinospora rosea]
MAVEPPSEEAEDVEDDTESDDERFIEICVREKTRVRVGYRPCDDARPGYAWYFVPLSARVPATGTKAKKGSFEEPDDYSYRAPAKGGRGSAVMIQDIEDRVQVCVSKRTRVRVADVRCDDEKQGYSWYYIRIDGYAPAVGKKAEDGSFRSPYTDAHRVRRKGGEAAEAAIRDDDLEEDEDFEDTEPDVEDANTCTETVDGVCTDTEDGTSECRTVHWKKRWVRRCTSF